VSPAHRALAFGVGCGKKSKILFARDAGRLQGKLRTKECCGNWRFFRLSRREEEIMLQSSAQGGRYFVPKLNDGSRVSLEDPITQSVNPSRSEIPAGDAAKVFGISNVRAFRRCDYGRSRVGGFVSGKAPKKKDPKAVKVTAT
jgi:hypothetical protein